MSVRKWLLPLAIVGLGTASVALAAPEWKQPAAPAAAAVDKASPQDQAAVAELRGLWKQARIANLELRLAEAKGAPESEIAAKQKAAEEARDRVRQWRADHPGLGRQLRHGMRGGRGMGMRGGGPRHRGGGMGMRGGRGMGPGSSMGMRGGRGMRGMMGDERGRGMRLRQRDPSQCPYVQTAPSAPAEKTQPK